MAGTRSTMRTTISPTQFFFGLLGSYVMMMRSNKAENLTNGVIALNHLAFYSEV